MFRLRLKLATTVRTAWTERAPSELWQSRRAGGKLAVNATHADFPALLAEALDVIDAMEGDVAQAAKCLGISTSQLVKLVGKHKPALSMVNQQRASRGLAKLR